MLKYKCLVLDHDDTVVSTTADIHYPSFQKTISAVRPDLNISKREFLMNCFDPGFYDYMEKILCFNKEEMDYQLKCWFDYIDDKIPSAYPGIADIIKRHKQQGGLVCVVSHSYKKYILRDYAFNIGVVPDMIWGGEEPEDRRKPSIYPLSAIQEQFDLDKKDMVVIDDLKPGLDMALNFGCDFICAGWSHTIPEITEYMKKQSPIYLSGVDGLNDLLFNK